MFHACFDSQHLHDRGVLLSNIFRAGGKAVSVVTPRYSQSHLQVIINENNAGRKFPGENLQALQSEFDILKLWHYWINTVGIVLTGCNICTSRVCKKRLSLGRQNAMSDDIACFVG